MKKILATFGLLLAFVTTALAGQVNLLSSYSNQVNATDVQLSDLDTTTVVTGTSDNSRFVLLTLVANNTSTRDAQLTMKIVLDGTTTYTQLVEISAGNHTIQFPLTLASLSIASHTLVVKVNQNTGPIIFTTDSYLGVFSPLEAGTYPSFPIQTENTVLAGPATAPAAAPAFRGLVSADIPNNAADTTGNAATSTALAADPTDCAAGPPQQYAKVIGANGNLTCQAIVSADLPATIAANTTGTAAALTANGANCAAGNAAGGVDAAGAAESCVPQGHAIEEEGGAPLTQRDTLNFIGAALTAADNGGSTRTEVTLSQSPASASVVGTGRTINTTAPITGGGDLSADRTIALGTLGTDQIQTSGTGSGTNKLEGVINVQTGSVCTGANTTETDLFSYTLPADTLSANGKAIRVTAIATTAANANNKTIRLYLGTQAATDTGATAFNNTDVFSTYTAIRTGASTEESMGLASTASNGNVRGSRLAGTQNTAATMTIKITGQNGIASANDICAKSLLVEVLN